MLRRNHGSIAERRYSSSTDAPRRNASAIAQSRSGRGVSIARQSAASLVRRRASGGSKPDEPISSERSAFCRLSLKVRPIAIASPTDFICVVSASSAPGNFSKVKRGIFVTT